MATATAAPPSVPDSRWWMLVGAGVAVGLLSALAAALVGVLFALVAVGVEIGAVPPVPLVLPAAGAPVVLAVLAFVLVTLLVALVLPLALYLDASAVADAGLDWTPDPGLYAVAALAGLLVQLPLGALVGLYYLYRRHGAVGVP